MHHDHARQLCRLFITGVLAEWAHEIALDGAIAIGRRYGDVFRLDALVILGDLLAERVIGHQGIDDRRGGQTGNSEALDPVQEIAPLDPAMNKFVVQLNRFGRDCPALLLFHECLPLIPVLGTILPVGRFQKPAAALPQNQIKSIDSIRRRPAVEAPADAVQGWRGQGIVGAHIGFRRVKVTLITAAAAPCRPAESGKAVRAIRQKIRQRHPVFGLSPDGMGVPAIQQRPGYGCPAPRAYPRAARHPRYTKSRAKSAAC